MLGQLLIVLALAGPEPATPKQLNLDCSGTVTVSNIIRSLAPRNAAQWSDVFRVDLSKNVWCQGKCEAISKIARQDQDYLMLQNESHTGHTTQTWIDRRTGRYYSTTDLSPFDSAITSGQCVVATFTGFAGPQF